MKISSCDMKTSASILPIPVLLHSLPRNVYSCRLHKIAVIEKKSVIHAMSIVYYAVLFLMLSHYYIFSELLGLDQQGVSL